MPVLAGSPGRFVPRQNFRLEAEMKRVLHQDDAKVFGADEQILAKLISVLDSNAETWPIDACR